MMGGETGGDMGRDMDGNTGSGTGGSAARTGLRERTRRAIQKEITEAAERLFVERGYEATTIEHIAEAVGMSRRTLYRYFSTREDVVLGKLDVVADEVLDVLRARPVDEPVWASLRHSFDGLIRHLDDAGNTELAEPMQRILFGTPGLLARYLEKLERSRARQSSSCASAPRPPAPLGRRRPDAPRRRRRRGGLCPGRPARVARGRREGEVRGHGRPGDGRRRPPGLSRLRHVDVLAGRLHEGEDTLPGRVAEARELFPCDARLDPVHIVERLPAQLDQLPGLRDELDPEQGLLRRREQSVGLVAEQLRVGAVALVVDGVPAVLGGAAQVDECAAERRVGADTFLAQPFAALEALRVRAVPPLEVVRRQ